MEVLKNHLKCRPTARVKLKTVTISVIVSSLILVIYQIVIIYKITNTGDEPSETEQFKAKQMSKKLIKPSLPQNEFSVNNLNFVGTLKSDKKYIPNMSGRILCIMDSIEIDVTKVNDDYCDCPADGMDEPGTNSCKNGRFFCKHQPDPKTFPKFIPSSQVNDGICDCCDGSDEWSGVVLPNRLTDETQKRLKRYQSPCSYRC